MVGVRLNARAKDKHAKQSALEEDQEREVLGATNQPECEKKWI